MMIIMMMMMSLRDMKFVQFKAIPYLDLSISKIKLTIVLIFEVNLKIYTYVIAAVEFFHWFLPSVSYDGVGVIISSKSALSF